LDHHNITPASIDKSLFSFNTRAFMIRYCEEEVKHRFNVPRLSSMI